jgi:5'-deoxynucleotidase YfbR-like HD superfamily hydrolase
MQTHNGEPDGWMQTHTGKRFTPLNPRAEDIDIEDIAHALSNMCRFGGHTREFYSVAQHSVLASELVPEHLQLAALMHDASEAYLVDVPRPIKRHLTNYAELEDKVSRAIATRFAEFGLLASDFSHPAVKLADNIMLVTEARDLLGVDARAQWGYQFDPLKWEVVPWPPAICKDAFMVRFHRLTVRAALT